MNTDSTFEDLTIASLFGLSHNDSAELAAGLEGDSFRALARQAKALREPVVGGTYKLAWLARWPSTHRPSFQQPGFRLAYRQRTKEKAERSCNAPSVPVTLTLGRTFD